MLRKLGTRGNRKAEGHDITIEEFKNHFEEVSRERYEPDPSDIEVAVSRTRDLREDPRAKEANLLLNETPQEEEIEREIKMAKESAPGKDGVRMKYIRKAEKKMEKIIVNMVKYMFENRAHKWDHELKEGQIIPVFKKGDRKDKNNYRGVCLLAMGSRILGRILASRLRWWSEHLGLTDDEQFGFRPGRSTADATQVMVRIEEDVKHLRKRRRRQREEEEGHQDPAAVLLDLRKAYSRVNKPALWSILEGCGFSGNFLNTLKDLHENIAYSVKGRGEESEQ